VTLTARAAALTVGGQPPAVARHVVRRAVADTVAVALAGRDEPVVRAVEAHTGLRAWAEEGPAEDAALVNGTAAHALDYDDNSDLLKGHPSAVLVPALLAAGDEDVADAYAVGFQIACAMAAGVSLEAHYARGWHATGTLMTVAAAAALARAKGLDEQRAAHAIALATSMAGGPRAQFGTQAKPLHAGLAASHGVLAARLAAEGMTGSAHALEGEHGFLAVFGEPGDARAAKAVLDGPWLLDERALNVKRYPCCGALQRTAAAALALTARDPSAVRVTIERGGTMPLLDGARTGAEARFSAAYVVAAALVDGELGLESFTDEAVGRPEVRALMERVELAESDQRRPFALIEADGETVRVDDLPPLSDEELEEKVSRARAATRVAASR
jgi:2-methylcitrate dehydratase PrpD